MSILRHKRKSLGLTQKQLAEKTGIAVLTYQRYEMDFSPRYPDAPTAVKIAQALHSSVEALWGEAPASARTQ